MVTDEERMMGLANLVLPWAKREAPDAYQWTLGVAQQPARWRKALLRLMELRAKIEPAFLRECPLWALEDSGCVVTMRHRPSGRVLDVAGQKIAGRRWSFCDLALDRQGFAARLLLDDLFELEYDPCRTTPCQANQPCDTSPPLSKPLTTYSP